MEIQTSFTPDFLQAKLMELGPWFYQFSFDNGVRTECLSDESLAIHESRARCIFPFLDDHFKERWQMVSCLDIACHEGWFSFQVAQRGARLVRGIDIRPERIERANFIREAGRFTNATFETRDLFSLDPVRDGTFDLTFFVGIFYHLEDLVRGFRTVRALTRNVCVIEGQVARHKGKITTAWGKKDELRSGPACVVIDADPNHTMPGSSISLIPSLEALQMIIRAAGFERTKLVTPIPSLHEQYIGFDRVMLFAFVY